MVRFVTLCLIQAYKLGFTFSSGVSRDPQYRLFLNSWLCWSFFCLSTEVKHLSRLFSYVSCGILFFDPNIVSTTFLKLRFLLVKLIFIPSFLFVMVPDLFFFLTFMLLVLFFFYLPLRPFMASCCLSGRQKEDLLRSSLLPQVIKSVSGQLVDLQHIFCFSPLSGSLLCGHSFT